MFLFFFIVPRKPVEVRAKYYQNTELVIVTWQPPSEFRGKILQYRVRRPKACILQKKDHKVIIMTKLLLYMKITINFAEQNPLNRHFCHENI